MAPLGRFPFSGCINHRWLVHVEYALLDILVVYLLGPHRFVYCVVVSHVLLCVSPLFHSFFLNIICYISVSPKAWYLGAAPRFNFNLIFFYF